jgi:hypothetical protein
LRSFAITSRCSPLAESWPLRSFSALFSKSSNASRACHQSWLTTHAEIGGLGFDASVVAPGSLFALSSAASRLRSAMNCDSGA